MEVGFFWDERVERGRKIILGELAREGKKKRVRERDQEQRHPSRVIDEKRNHDAEVKFNEEYKKG